VRESASGFKHRVFIWADMPRLQDAYLRCIIYLYASEEAARRGDPEGGSGFLVFVRSELEPFGQGGHIYAVTNRHVVKDSGCTFIRYNTWPDGFDVLPAEGSWVWDKDDDIAVAPVELPVWSAYITVDLDHFSVTHEKLKAYNIGLGDDVFMLGRLIGNEGKGRNMPVLRFGNISRMPSEDEPIVIKGRKQEAYLVEMRSISGHSGSPVFFYVPYHNIPDGDMKERRGWAIGPLLLGIDCAHLTEPSLVLTEEGHDHPQLLHVKSNSGMAAVIPAWRLMKLLDKGKLRMARNKKDERELAKRKLRDTGGGFEPDMKRPQERGEITTEGFEEALRRASRKTSSQPESESDET
jgi:hypothetical protein